MIGGEVRGEVVARHAFFVVPECAGAGHWIPVPAGWPASFGCFWLAGWHYRCDLHSSILLLILAQDQAARGLERWATGNEV